LRVKNWKLAQPFVHSFENKWHERQLRAGAFVKLVTLRITQFGDTRHVDLVDGSDMRRSASRQDHVFRNLLAHHAHLFDTVAGAWFGRRRSRNFRKRLCGCHTWRLYRRRYGWSPSTGLNVAKNVVLCYAATQTSPLELGNINSVLLGNFAYQRTRLGL